MKIVLFAGPGRVGKTTQLELVVQRLKDRNVKVDFHKSSTRKTYEKFGLTKEDDALRDPGFNRVFQEQVLMDNFSDLKLAIVNAKNDDVEVFISDRSLFDYSSYFFCVFQSDLTIAEINRKRTQINEMMKELIEIDNDITHCQFNFPMSWSIDQTSSDEWRSDKTGKNFVWNGLLREELNRFLTFGPNEIIPDCLNRTTDTIFQNVIESMNQ